MRDNYKILIVEDSKTSAAKLRQIISSEINVSEFYFAETKEQIIDFLSKQKIDIIILDYFLEGYTAIDALQIIRENNKFIPVIVVSAQFGDDRLSAMIKAGANDFVKKENYKRLVPSILKEINNYLIKKRNYRQKNQLAKINEILQENKSSSSFFNSILENIPSPIIVKNINDRKIIYSNSQFLNYLDIENITGLQFEDVFSNETNKFFKQCEEKVIKTNDTFIVESAEIFTKNNITKNVFLRFIIIKEEEEPKYILTIFKDISDILITKTKQKNLESRFFTIFNKSPISVVISRISDNTIIFSNEAFSKMTGYSMDEIIYKNNKYLEIWADVNLRNQIVKNALNQEGNHHNIDAQLIRKDGTIFDTIVSVEKIEINNETMVVFMGVEITERKNMERELRATLKKQKELNLIRNHFVSLISHEYRTPLTSIMLSVDILRRYGDNWDSREKEKHFQRIQDTILRMTQMMENVLILGNIESGLLGFNADKFNFDAFCKSIAKNTEINFHNKVYINYLYTANKKEYILDENLTGLIVTHLLNNAAKYSEKKSSIVEFKISDDDENLYIEVSDEGIGIPQKDLPNIYKEFFRASNTENISGYGLGLTIVNRAVESHKGSIEIKSVLNKGTKVKVTLPIL